MSIITIATDFGTADGFVGAMTGVIKTIAPDTEVVDVTHNLSTIIRATLVIERYFAFFPPGTIHLVVVDPTVGSDRKPLIGKGGGYYFVGPDNGIFSKAVSRIKKIDWWAIDLGKLPFGKISSTFHGRDIFAPAAAYLASGKLPEDLGKRVEMVEIIELPAPLVKSKMIEGEVIDIDNFGNLVTNIKSEMFTPGMFVSLLNGDQIAILKTYSDVPKGEALGYENSAGYLELGVNSGRADNLLKAFVGTKVLVML